MTLTKGERLVLRLLAEGLMEGEIAHRLCRNPATIRTHVAGVGVKLGTTRRALMVRFAVRAGIVEV